MGQVVHVDHVLDKLLDATPFSEFLLPGYASCKLDGVHLQQVEHGDLHLQHDHPSAKPDGPHIMHVQNLPVPGVSSQDKDMDCQLDGIHLQQVEHGDLHLQHEHPTAKADGPHIMHQHQL